MYVKRNVSLKLIFWFGWKNVLIFLVLSSAVVLCYHFFDWQFLSLPFLPISLIGTAAAFYVGFKNSQSYDRLWEARRIWGGIVNDSRNWGIFVKDFVTEIFTGEAISIKELESWHQRLIYRHLAWINVLRIQLRRPQLWEHNPHSEDWIRGQLQQAFGNDDLKIALQQFLPEEEAEKVMGTKNVATQLLVAQSSDLLTLRKANFIDDFRHMELQRLLSYFYNHQGACERIKNFPFPRQYAFFSGVFVWIFILFLPMGLLSEFSKLGDSYIWLTIPATTLIGWFFMTMELVGDYSENPFENLLNDVPMTALCRTIEIDLREMLGETNLPPKVEPIEDILM